MANVCIFCSSSERIEDKYKEMGYQLGQMIAQAGHNLVYGGAIGGLMTTVAQGAHDAGGHVTGIVTDHVARHGLQSDIPDCIVTTANLAERKQTMLELADCFVAMPGGCGTLDELFTVTAAGIMGEHRKPLYLVNTDGFYDSLLKELIHMKALSFIPAEESYRPHVVSTIEECMEAVNTPAAPKKKKKRSK